MEFRVRTVTAVLPDTTKTTDQQKMENVLYEDKDSELPHLIGIPSCPLHYPSNHTLGWPLPPDDH